MKHVLKKYDSVFIFIPHLTPLLTAAGKTRESPHASDSTSESQMGSARHSSGETTVARLQYPAELPNAVSDAAALNPREGVQNEAFRPNIRCSGCPHPPVHR